MKLLFIIAIVGFSSDSFRGNLSSKVTIEEQQPNNRLQIPKQFTKDLQQGKSLQKYFAENWTFYYEQYFRGMGQTSGFIKNLSVEKINKTIALIVHCDGEGWFEKKPAKKYNYKFVLNKQISDWDRYEVEATDESNKFYIHGGGASEYIYIYFNKDNKIEKLSFYDIDPG